MSKLSQLKHSPASVISENWRSCADTVVITFFVGVFFYAVEYLARKFGLGERLISPFSEVIKGQLDILSVVVFYSVIIFYAGVHLILSNVVIFRPLMRSAFIETKMDVFYVFVLQYIAAAIGVRTGVFAVKLFTSINPLAGTRNIALLAGAAVLMTCVWYAKGITEKSLAFVLGAAMIITAGALYCSLSFSVLQKFIGA